MALNENQFEQSYYGVAALQRSINGADVQFSYFTRYSSVHFVPDAIGDIVFNGVASDVFRSDIANGVTTDVAYRLNEAHTLRGGFLVRTDLTDVANTNTLLPVVAGTPVDAPFTVLDASKKLGYTASFYVQDEWRITNWLILSSGLRYDQYWAYISENQFSPRFSLTWKPFNTTTFHAGYARTFTPPEQVLAAPTNLALVQGTTQQPSVHLAIPCGRSAPTLRRRRGAASAAGIGSRRRRLLQEGHQPDRRRPVRRSLRPDRLQLCPREKLRFQPSPQ